MSDLGPTRGERPLLGGAARWKTGEVREAILRGWASGTVQALRGGVMGKMAGSDTLSEYL